VRKRAVRHGEVLLVLAIMQRQACLFLALTVVLPGSAVCARCQQFQPKSIQFKGDSEYSQEELLAAAGLKVGQVLTYAQMNQCSKQLMDTGMFASLDFKFDGQDLVFQLTPADQLYPVQIANLPLKPGAELDAKLHEAIPLYHGKVPGQGGLADTVTAQLEKLLATQGMNVTVVATPATDPKTGKVGIMSYSITSPAVWPEVTKMDGVSASLAGDVQEVVKEAEKNAYDTNASAQNIDQAITLFYRDRGYAAVKVETAQTGAPEVTAEAIRVPFQVTVQEGRVYKLGAVTVPADSPLTQADADKLLSSQNMHLSPGVKLRVLLGAVAEGYQSKGYLDCKVALKPSFDEGGDTVNYAVTAVPGPVSHLAFVKFENVGDNLRKVLMRNWTMMPGDAFDEPFAATYLLRLTAADPKLGQALRGVVEKMTTTEDPQTHDVNVVIRLEKRP
jgi:outer membrane protein assembly factor BamA